MTRPKMIVGTSSDAGKSTVVAAVCRYLANQGMKVVPFKSQNMALNSAVTEDGFEIGRAQYAQAFAARTRATVEMNPILLKPESDRTSQVILNGESIGSYSAVDYQTMKASLIDGVLDSFSVLERDADVVIMEGAGSPAEINLLEYDIVNLNLAERVSARAALVADIDRGGVFAHILGTYSILPENLRGLLDGYLINRFRGDVSLLGSGLTELSARIGSECFGTLPYIKNTMLDKEDSLSLAERGPARPSGKGPDAPLRIRVVRLPHLSNYTDFDPLSLEPSCEVSYVDSPSGLADADLVILPGSKSTIGDLNWLRSRFGDSISRYVDSGRFLMGVCGGYQMLGKEIEDGVECEVEGTEGMGLLDVTTHFKQQKLTLQRSGNYIGSTLDAGPSVSGYQIHNGRVAAGPSNRPIFRLVESPARARFGIDDGVAGNEGSRSGNVFGTTLHGVFEADGFRRNLLEEVARSRDRRYEPGRGFYEVRELHYESLAKWLSQGTEASGFLPWLKS